MTDQPSVLQRSTPTNLMAWIAYHSISAMNGLRLRCGAQARANDDRGQTTAEYALVLIGAVAVAVLLIGWVTGSGKIGELFDAVFDSIISKVK